jgi:hypothetical protein
MRRSEFSLFSLIGAIAAGLAGLSAPLLISSPAMANPYESCVERLLGTGVSQSDAAASCASALDPDDLADCVTTISDGTTIASTEALSSCRRVRRPDDMASCVVTIEGDLQDAVPLDVLDTCRRSLIPSRYSECVVGLNAAGDISPEIALRSCVAADYNRPVEPPDSFILQPEIDSDEL